MRGFSVLAHACVPWVLPWTQRCSSVCACVCIPFEEHYFAWSDSGVELIFVVLEVRAVCQQWGSWEPGG